MTTRHLILFLVFVLAFVSAQWGRPPVVVEKTIITRPGFGRGPGGFGGGPGWGRPGWGGGGGWGRPQTIIKETIIRPGK